jgi:hypothetical protein
MPDNEAPQGPLYDHEDDDARQATRRRRPVADWGVGEELFDHMPRRRFARAGELQRRVSGEERRPARGEDHRGHADVPRRGADDARRTIVIETRDDELVELRPDGQVAGDAAGAAASAAGAAASAAGAAAREAGPAAPERGAAAPGAASGSRRTVRISGRPEAVDRRSFDAPRRARRPRTVGDRVGSRPDRVAAWAFALGLLLILIAVATAKADAAVPVAHPAAPRPAVTAPPVVRDFQPGTADR